MDKLSRILILSLILISCKSQKYKIIQSDFLGSNTDNIKFNYIKEWDHDTATMSSFYFMDSFELEKYKSSVIFYRKIHSNIYPVFCPNQKPMQYYDTSQNTIVRKGKDLHHTLVIYHKKKKIIRIEKDKS